MAALPHFDVGSASKMGDCADGDVCQKEPFSRLKEGFNLKDLIETLSTEFTLDPSKAIPEETEEESRVENVFAYDDFAPHINFECINVGSEDDSGLSPFDQLKKKMSPVTEDGLVLKWILRHGHGEVIPPKCVAYCHYNSYFELEEVPFDSSYLRTEKPMRIEVGAYQLYRGFEEGLITMKVGEKSQFLIDPMYAFGDLGVPPRIPPKATILLEIELIKYVECGEAIEAPEPDMSQEERDEFPTMYKKAKAFHALGNDNFQQKKYSTALDNYRKAENILYRCKLNSDEEEFEWKKLLLKLQVNKCVVYNTPKMNAPEKICSIAKDAFLTIGKLAERSAKLHFCLGKANMALCNYAKARNEFHAALLIEPHNKEINDALAELEEKKKKYYAYEKITYQKALGLKEAKTAQTEKPQEQEDDEFTNVLREELENFARGNSSRLQLPAGLTVQERNVCRKLAKEMGLTCEDVMICGDRSFAILK